MSEVRTKIIEDAFGKLRLDNWPLPGRAYRGFGRLSRMQRRLTDQTVAVIKSAHQAQKDRP